MPFKRQLKKVDGILTKIMKMEGFLSLLNSKWLFI